MSSFTIIKNILKAQNAQLLRQIAEKYGLDEEEMMSKYLRPTFFLPDMVDAPAVICYKELHGIKKTSKNTVSTTRGDGGDSLFATPSEDPR
jgi:hypothetical protein